LGDFSNFHRSAASLEVWLLLLYVKFRVIHHCVHGLRVADPSRIADKSLAYAYVNPWRSIWPANDSGHSAYSDQRGGDYNYASEYIFS
jgi:hypothetical protein